MAAAGHQGATQEPHLGEIGLDQESAIDTEDIDPEQSPNFQQFGMASPQFTTRYQPRVPSGKTDEDSAQQNNFLHAVAETL